MVVWDQNIYSHGAFVIQEPFQKYNYMVSKGIFGSSLYENNFGAICRDERLNSNKTKNLKTNKEFC